MVSARKALVDEVSAKQARFAEIESIRRSHKGLVQVDDIIEFAQGNPQSALHGAFDWNVQKAAREHWRWQARELLQQYWVTSRIERQPVRAWISVKSDRKRPKGGYRSSDDVLTSPKLRAEWTEMAFTELREWKARYAALTELSPVFRAIDRMLKTGKPEAAKE